MWHYLALLMLCGGPAEDGFAPPARILSQHCVRCHNAEKTRGGLDLSSRATALAGGATGDAIVPGDPEQSSVWQRAKDHSMPPPRDGRPLSAAELGVLTRWIAEGAVWPEERTLSPTQPMPRRGEKAAVKQPIDPSLGRPQRKVGFRRRSGALYRVK